jgi:tRNA threonylcarbamoyladenosine biosynthesis protein TsaB
VSATVRLLALETSTLTGSVAAFDSGALANELQLDPHQRSAQSLAPAIKTLLESVNWKPADIEWIAVAVGPGSFTGLRVGVTTAKALAYATGAQVLGVNTLEAIAQSAPPAVASLWAIIDAHRSQVFASRFERDASGVLQPVEATRAIGDDDWLGLLRSGDTVSGPGLVKLQARLPAGVTTLPAELWPATARSVGQIALRRHAAGQRDDLWALSPQYYRASAAEERISSNGGSAQT